MNNSFYCRSFHDSDYPLLCEWWDAWGFPRPPKECLPINGLIVCDGEGPLYAGFMFFTDSSIAWIEWVVSDKHASVSRKRGALDYLISSFEKMAKGRKVKHFFTSTVRPEFINSLKKCGFEVGDRDVVQLIKNI